MKLLIMLLLLTLFLFSDGQIESKLLPPKNHQIYFGAFPDFGGSEESVSTQKIDDFESIVGKKIAWAYFSQNWYRGIVYPKVHIHAIVQSGAIPFVRLMSCI